MKRFGDGRPIWVGAAFRRVSRLNGRTTSTGFWTSDKGAPQGCQLDLSHEPTALWLGALCVRRCADDCALVYDSGQWWVERQTGGGVCGHEPGDLWDLMERGDVATREGWEDEQVDEGRR